MGRTGGPSGMTAENLNAWLREATRGKYPEREHWDKLASIKKLEFRNGHTLEALSCTTMSLIPKVGGGYRCIGLVDVI